MYKVARGELSFPLNAKILRSGKQNLNIRLYPTWDKKNQKMIRYFFYTIIFKCVMDEIYIILFPSLVVLLFFITSIFKKKKKDNRKIIKKLPVSDIKDVKKVSGLIKVKGGLIKIKTIQSYLTKKQCIGYDYKAMKWVTTDRFDNDHSSKRWKTIESIEECYDFYIQDQTGKIKVEAEDISIISSSNEKKTKKDKISYFENLLLPNKDDYYVIGSVNKNDDEYTIVRDIVEKELSIFDVKSYDLLVDIPQSYRIGCTIFLIGILISFFYLFFYFYN